ncbi:MAG: hypothetical protein QNJ17_04700 [Desulfocapsaceae bacterium]|nr:hypothetical protein [Desulfocapsaceae bacterium]
MDVLDSKESGEKFLLKVDGLGYDVELPFVVVPGRDADLRIASFNLVGQIKLNQDLGRLLAAKIREVVREPTKIVILTAVEKALQLTQVVAAELGVDAIAVAYNRIKPHMEVSRRPLIQVGADSITSGGKFLAVYERDMQLLSSAENGFIIIDDVVSTGGTVMGLYEILEEAVAHSSDDVPLLHGIFCVATEGSGTSLLPAPVHALAELPVPEAVSG